MFRIGICLVFVSAAFLAVGAFMFPRREADSPVQERQRDAFAFDRDGEPTAIAFDGQRAMQYLKQICALGPRQSGTDGMKKQQELLKKYFEDHDLKVRFQRFEAKQRQREGTVAMANLIISWHAERNRRVILCSHYDTRPIADQEPDPHKWTEPFISANDGGSGVAFLMELANHLKELKMEAGIDFVLFDGEEYVFRPEGDKYFFGSEQFAKEYRQKPKDTKYIAAVLLDMIGGKNAHFPVEQHSFTQAGALVQDIWSLAIKMHSPVFVNQMGAAVMDDHLALNQAGIPAVDLIDFEYPHWHRLSDIPANCSAASLNEVARVLTAWLGQQK
jgi:hypothetical protein